MVTLFEVGVDILIFIRLLRGLQAPFRGFGLVGGGIIIHDTYVVNTVYPLHPEVSDKNTPLRLSYVL